MIASSQLAWTLTVVFVVTGGHALFRSVRPRFGDDPMPLADRVGHLLHLLMSAAMLAMIWPWGGSLPHWPQILLFGFAVLWFALRTWLGDRLPGCRAHAVVQGRWHHAQHAVMFTAMAWMLIVMPYAPVPTGTSGGHHHSAGHHGSAAMGDHGAEPTMPVLLAAISLNLAVCCVALTWWWLSRAIDAGRGALSSAEVAPETLRLAAAEAVRHAAMSLGMGVMLWMLL